MSRGLLPALSALTLFGGTALYYLWKKTGTPEVNIVDRLVLKAVLIRLRKRVYSTLREIAFIVNHIRTLEGDLQVKKISQIFMRDGGSGQKKLQAIEALVLQEFKISQKEFEASCNHYVETDIEIKLLLQLFRKDLNMALQGVIESYKGPLPLFDANKVLRIEQQLVKRRMGIICKKYVQGVSTEQCLRLQGQIQEYLLEEGICHEKEPHQKLFMSMLEHCYRHDHYFKEQFEQLQMQLELFLIEIENKYAHQLIESSQNQQQNQNYGHRQMIPEREQLVPEQQLWDKMQENQRQQ